MGKIVGAVVGFVFLLVILAVLAALPTWLLWNWLVPDITKGALTEVTFWQAFGINLLAGILFKSSASGKSD